MLARILGGVFVVLGIVGFLPWVTAPADMTSQYVTLGAKYGFALGLFPVNAVHDALHLIFGGWGLIASLRFRAAVRYCRWVSWIYGILVIVGAIPITNTLFGIAPIYGHDIWLHALIALAALYGGYGRATIEPIGLDDGLPTGAPSSLSG